VTDPVAPGRVPRRNIKLKEFAMNPAVLRLASGVFTARGARALAALVLSATCAVPTILGAAPGKTVEVDIAKFAYGPNNVTVAPGTTIVWINHDETPHTVTSSDKSFASKGMDTGDKFEHTFAAEGDFTYICTVHPLMTGTVHVHK
jgi:plastocyanin